MDNFKSGHHVNQNTYKSFQPAFITRKWNLGDDMELQELLGQANRALGRLDMFSEYVPNIDLFIGMHIVKEATQSSKIEGTKTDIEDALHDKNSINKEKRDDWIEVQNYIFALNNAIQNLEELPISSRLIRLAHKTLMKGGRGEHKMPGEFRTSQNWIGGTNINNAIFIPPHHTTIHDYMGDLEKFVHTEKHFFPDILKIALIHYQFETIHPFLDGNGRVGRLLITLYLVEKGLLKKPILYLSDFFEKNKTSYYDNLMRVREKSDLNQWFKFFLTGTIETAQKSIKTFDNILKLQKEINIKIQSLGNRSANAQLLVTDLFKHPIINIELAKVLINVSLPTLYSLLNDLEELGIIKEATGGKRNKIFIFQEYVNLFK